MGKNIPLTLYVDDYEELPNCERCGKPLKETYIWKDDVPFYSWWCETESCKRESDEAFNKFREQKYRDEVEEKPESILPKYGIPKKYWYCSPDTFQGYEALVEKCRKYIQKPESSLLFTGNCGTGKTHLAISILRELIKNGLTDVFFKSVPELLLDIRRTFNNSQDITDADIIDHHSLFGLLVLDDFGAEKITEFTISSLYMIIDRRVREDKPTIITTNLSLDEIEKKISPRIASRLAEYEVWKFNMPDYRKIRNHSEQ